MDYIDEKILEILQTDCLKTAKEMAAELALTATPIYERIKKLENAGYIKDYVALLDADLLGQIVLLFVSVGSMIFGIYMKNPDAAIITFSCGYILVYCFYFLGARNLSKGSNCIFT